MASIRRQEGCCGVRELYNLGGLSIDIITQVDQAVKSDNLNAAYYMFADTAKGHAAYTGNGDKLARYITKHSLGLLSSAGPTYNPQSDRKIKVWLWAIDQEAISKLVASK